MRSPLRLLIAGLALSASTLAPLSASATAGFAKGANVGAPLPRGGFTIVRCNANVRSGLFSPVLYVTIDGKTTAHKSGENGLTRRIALEGRLANAWVRQVFAQQTAGRTALYHQNCGIRPERTDPISVRRAWQKFR